MLSVSYSVLLYPFHFLTSGGKNYFVWFWGEIYSAFRSSQLLSTALTATFPYQLFAFKSKVLNILSCRFFDLEIRTGKINESTIISVLQDSY